MLIRTIYVSRASSPMPLELKEILAVSRTNNPLLGIGGAMCFLDGVYMQFLEGEEEAVDALYKKIEADPRHTQVKLLVSEALAQREFPRWSMALLTWSEETRAIFKQFNPNIACDLYAADPDTVAALMRAWAGTNNWMTL